MEIKAQEGHLHATGNENPNLNSDVDKQIRARSLVYGYIKSSANFSPDIQFSDVVIVWFSKTLQNWKSLVAIPEKSDLYFEITHNGDKRETYIDVYKKIYNMKVSDAVD